MIAHDLRIGNYETSSRRAQPCQPANSGIGGKKTRPFGANIGGKNALQFCMGKLQRRSVWDVIAKQRTTGWSGGYEPEVRRCRVGSSRSEQLCQKHGVFVPRGRTASNILKIISIASEADASANLPVRARWFRLKAACGPTAIKRAKHGIRQTSSENSEEDRYNEHPFKRHSSSGCSYYR